MGLRTNGPSDNKADPVWVDIMKCYLVHVHAYFSGGLDRQIALNFNIIHVFIERYVFLKKTWGFPTKTENPLLRLGMKKVPVFPAPALG